MALAPAAPAWFNCFCEEEFNRHGRPLMVAQTADQVELGFHPPTPVLVQRHRGQITSDAGLLPVLQFDATWRYTERMAECLTDARPDRRQPLASILRQRVFGIVAGHPDCNDHDDLRQDPVFKFVADDRGPDGPALASQPTLSAVRERRAAGRSAAAGRVPRGDRRRTPPRPPRRRTSRPRSRSTWTPPTIPTHGRQQLSPVPRLLRPVPVLPAGRLRADDQARVRRLAPARDGPRVARGRRRPDGGRERPAGWPGPAWPSTPGATRGSACR